MNDQDRIIEAAARFAQQQQGQSIQPQLVQPQPCPMSVQIAGGQGPDAKNYVLLIIHTMTGQNVYHFEADGAEHIANALLDAARTARTGLEIPRLS